jgi:hypothetical protein
MSPARSTAMAAEPPSPALDETFKIGLALKG